MEEKQNLYFIAIVPDDQICKEIISFKEDFANRFGSKAALKVVPHITLKAPFHFPANDHDKLAIWFEELPVQSKSFQMELKNFGAFPKPKAPVIFIPPVENPLLHNLQKEIIGNYKISFPEMEINIHELKFHPHITVAYRDLKPDEFKEAWKEYETKKYNAFFIVNNFHLLQHDEKKWNIIRTYLLS